VLPPIAQVPVTAASVSPVRRWSRNRRLRYEVLEEKDRGSIDVTALLVSLNVPGSASMAMRSRAVIE